MPFHSKTAALLVLLTVATVLAQPNGSQLPKPTRLIVAYRGSATAQKAVAKLIDSTLSTVSGGQSARNAAMASLAISEEAAVEAAAAGAAPQAFSVRHQADATKTFTVAPLSQEVLSNTINAAPPPPGGAFFVALDNSTTADRALAQMKRAKNRNVKFVEYDYPLQTFATPSECGSSTSCPDDARYWGYNMMRMPTLWARTSFGGTTRRVGVIDTGMRVDHVEFQGILDVGASRTCVNGCFGNGNDDQGHGTHVGGTVAARHGNGGGSPIGVTDRAAVVACKFLQASGGGSTSDAVACIDYLLSIGVPIMTNSWGSYGGRSTWLGDAVRRVCNAGGLFLVAAGNDGLPVFQSSSNAAWPAAFATEPGFDCVLTVAAVGRDTNLASFSNFGPRAQIAAPGVNIFSTHHTSSTATATFSGTSMATPMVAGAAVGLWNKYPTLTAAQVKAALVNSGTSSATLNGRTIAGRILDVDRAEQLAAAASGGSGDVGGTDSIKPVSAPNLCVNAPDWSDGTQLTIAPCSGTSAQRLQRLSDGSLRFAGTNKCVDVNFGGKAAGTRIQAWECNGSPAQRWQRDESNALRPACAPNMCLDVPSQNFVSGQALHLWDCNKTPAQVFTATMVPVVPTQSISVANLCVDAPTWDDGRRLYMYNCHGGNNQRLERLADGSLRFVGTNKCIDVAFSGTRDGTIVQVWQCNGTPAQQWRRDSADRLRPAVAPNMCLDIPGANLVERNELQLWSCNSSPAQVFRADMVPVTVQASSADDEAVAAAASSAPPSSPTTLFSSPDPAVVPEPDGGNAMAAVATSPRVPEATAAQP